MQYSYDQWANRLSGRELEAENRENYPADVGSFPFAAELRALEENLSLGLDEGLEAYRQHQETQAASSVQEEVWQALQETPEDHWDDLARQVADHVMAHMLENPVQTELEQLHAQVGEYYQDNRTLSEQAQKLMEENDQLRQALSHAELELARFRPILGNLFIKL